MKYVLIGNSTAAIGCIEGIRQIDNTGEIILVSEEKHHTYGRPLISYLLQGKTKIENIYYRKNDFYKKNDVITILGKKVIKINNDKKEIILNDNTIISYDKLFVGTGSRCFIPPIKGLDKVDYHTFYTLDDANKLSNAINNESKVLILGAGLIGLKCAEGIYKRVKSIDVVDLADRILPSILDTKSSQIVQKHIEKSGINIILSDSIIELKGNKAILSSGKEIDFDVLVIAVGVRANTELLVDCGAEVNRGVIVDLNNKTSINDIYAAGDCTEGYDMCLDDKRVLALLPNAYIGGECAGINMAGGSKLNEKAIPMNAIGFFGLHTITAGVYEGKDYLCEKQNNYKRLCYADNKLKGFILIGDVQRAGIYTNLIREKTPLDTIDFELIKDRPQLIALSRVERLKHLGGYSK